MMRPTPPAAQRRMYSTIFGVGEPSSMKPRCMPGITKRLRKRVFLMVRGWKRGTNSGGVTQYLQRWLQYPSYQQPLPRATNSHGTDRTRERQGTIEETGMRRSFVIGIALVALDVMATRSAYAQTWKEGTHYF